MTNEQDKKPSSDTQSDISKAQAPRQPTGQDRPDEAMQDDTLTKQKSDFKPTAFEQEKGESESGFVGTKGQQDSSSELVEDEGQARKDEETDRE